MTVFITGGTSGIGYSLAKHYSSTGCRVGICGRNVTTVPNNKEVDLQVYEADVSVMSSVFLAVESFLNEKEDLDLFINCAGSYAEDVVGQISYEEAEQMLKTNILGTINCFEVSRTAMKNQQSGQIAVIASVSGILDYENSSLYTKTKRSVIQIADAYHRALRPFGICVTTVAPGYIDTPKLRALNKGDVSKKPFLIDIDSATKIISTAINDREKLLIFPTKMKWMMKSLSFLPSSFLNLIMYRKAKWMKND
ncbi:SDR family oxidoreductase [Chryseobacterium sp. SNU WT5]|uniref:SDR family NAD(P)-dependent oxidoreductase n=1 Tax=Chryseobacterium sp. SNU WT5 TaxID=2594269 RepID=UPI00117C6E27|nr:SDR family oxidoreductase [Chryseobacterium sp. SNU WT5]QDP84932.1 SDR family oxidoreductase [Chryseobacterium sp. SNU WT5]